MSAAEITVADQCPKLRWRSEPPTEPGWYWWRGGSNPGDLRHVEDFNGGLKTFDMTGSLTGFYPVAKAGGEWYGPLKPPE